MMTDKPQEDIDEMEGPQLIARYKDDERKSISLKADDDFGPFLVIVFQTPLSPRMHVYPGGGISPVQLALIEKQMTLMLAQINVEAVAEQIERQNQKLIKPDDFRMQAINPKTGRPYGTKHKPRR